MTTKIHRNRFFIYSFLVIFNIFFISCETDENRFDINHTDSVSTDSTFNNEEPNDNIVGENILQNGSVEKWEMVACEHPTKWLLPSGNCNKVTRNQDVVHEGLYSAKMNVIEKGTTARVSQMIKVTPKSKIRIRFHYYVEQWKTNGARTYCYFRTGPQESTNISIEELRSIYSTAEYYIIRGGGLGKTYLPHNLMTWQVFDETISVPPNANYFEFGINSYLGTIVYVDDCYVIEKNE